MRNSRAKTVILLAVIAVLFWWPSSKFQFLNYDDNEYVFENETLKAGLSFEGITWAFNYGYAANWHPLAWISTMVDVSLVRTAERKGIVRRVKPIHDTWVLDCDESSLAWVTHVHNILLHAANTVLVFVLAMMLCGAVDTGYTRSNGGDSARLVSASCQIIVCAVAAALWAVHPLRAEVVCWVSERKELLSVFFMLLAIIAWMKGTKLFCLVAMVLHALALMSKPVAVTLPLVLFAYDWMIRGRRFTASALRVLPFVILSFGTSVFTLLAQREAMPGLDDMSVCARVTCVLKAPLVYLFQTIVPCGISSWYSVPKRPEWFWGAAGLLLVSVLVAVVIWWLKSRRRLAAWAAFAVVWCYGGLIPMLGIVKVGGQPHSDRYTYWVGCGAAALMAVAGAWAIAYVERRIGDVSQRAARCAAALLLLPYAACGFMKMFTWHDSLVLFREGWENSHEPDQAFTYATNLMFAGRYPEAEAAMREADSKNRTAKTRGRLALVLAQKEHSPSLEEARYLAESALAGDPKVGEAYAALGHICLRGGDKAKAIRNYELAGKNGFKDRLVESLLERCIKEMSAEKENGK